MKTFILLTFGFLVFAFYQLSGGADFEPASTQVAEEITPPAAPAQTASVVEPVTAAAAIDTAVIAALDEEEATVTRVSMDLTNVEAAAVQQTQPSSTAQIIDSSETPQIILPSLIATTNTSAETSDRNVRSVSGNRVNVRGGPSTDYSVISRLNRGDEVRILEDNGNGWVLMEPLDGGESGWMADFLLTSG